MTRYKGGTFGAGDGRGRGRGGSNHSHNSFDSWFDETSANDQDDYNYDDDQLQLRQPRRDSRNHISTPGVPAAAAANMTTNNNNNGNDFLDESIHVGTLRQAATTQRLQQEQQQQQQNQLSGSIDIFSGIESLRGPSGNRRLGGSGGVGGSFTFGQGSSISETSGGSDSIQIGGSNHSNGNGNGNGRGNGNYDQFMESSFQLTGLSPVPQQPGLRGKRLSLSKLPPRPPFSPRAATLPPRSPASPASPHVPFQLSGSMNLLSDSGSSNDLSDCLPGRGQRQLTYQSSTDDSNMTDDDVSFRLDFGSGHGTTPPSRTASAVTTLAGNRRSSERNSITIHSHDSSNMSLDDPFSAFQSGGGYDDGFLEEMYEQHEQSKREQQLQRQSSQQGNKNGGGGSGDNVAFIPLNDVINTEESLQALDVLGDSSGNGPKDGEEKMSEEELMQNGGEDPPRQKTIRFAKRVATNFGELSDSSLYSDLFDDSHRSYKTSIKSVGSAGSGSSAGGGGGSFNASGSLQDEIVKEDDKEDDDDSSEEEKRIRNQLLYALGGMGVMALLGWLINKIFKCCSKGAGGGEKEGFLNVNPLGTGGEASGGGGAGGATTATEATTATATKSASESGAGALLSNGGTASMEASMTSSQSQSALGIAYVDPGGGASSMTAAQ